MADTRVEARSHHTYTVLVMIVWPTGGEIAHGFLVIAGYLPILKIARAKHGCGMHGADNLLRDPSAESTRFIVYA